MENICDNKQKKETHLEVRLGGLRESNNRLELVIERIQQLEVRISGDRIKDLKDSAKSGDEPMPSKSAIISDLNDLNKTFNYLISDLEESISHLEDFI